MPGPNSAETLNLAKVNVKLQNKLHVKHIFSCKGIFGVLLCFREDVHQNCFLFMSKQLSAHAGV